MTLESFIANIESEWEPEVGFFWNIRRGVFLTHEYERVLAKFVAVPTASDIAIPTRLVSVLWYVPVFMHWQIERVRESGGELEAYTKAMNQLTAEVERILGVP